MKKYPLIFFVLLMLLLNSCEPLTPVPAPLSAVIADIEGENVSVLHIDASDFLPAVLEEMLEVNSQTKTGIESRARIDLSSGTIIRLSPESLFTLEANHESEAGLFTRLRVEIGQVWIILNGGSLEVETPSGLAGVRGSYMSTGYDPVSGAARITCLEGHCSAENEAGSVEFTAGEAADLPADGGAPIKGLMTDEEFQMWAENVPEAGNLVPTPVPPTPTAMPAATPQPKACSVTSTFLYIRTCAETTCETLGYAEQGTELTIISGEKEDGWQMVQIEGQVGWINASYCE